MGEMEYTRLASHKMSTEQLKHECFIVILREVLVANTGKHTQSVACNFKSTKYNRTMRLIARHIYLSIICAHEVMIMLKTSPKFHETCVNSHHQKFLRRNFQPSHCEECCSAATLVSGVTSH